MQVTNEGFLDISSRYHIKLAKPEKMTIMYKQRRDSTFVLIGKIVSIMTRHQLCVARSTVNSLFVGFVDTNRCLMPMNKSSYLICSDSSSIQRKKIVYTYHSSVSIYFRLLPFLRLRSQKITRRQVSCIVKDQRYPRVGA